MAIFKAVTRPDGTAAGRGRIRRLEDYLKYETDERGRLQLDDHGHPVPRDAIVTALNGDADNFAFSCQEIFAEFNANRKPDDVKYKHYVQGFPPEDNEKMDRETCHRLGVELARTVWPDFPVLVVSHFDQETDGVYHWHNHFLVGNCSVTNGKRLCTSSAAMWAQKRFVAAQAEANGLARRGLVLEDGGIREAGERETTYEHKLAKELKERGRALSYEELREHNTLTQKAELRLVIREAARETRSFGEFRAFLKNTYDVDVKITRGVISYLHPDRAKADTRRGNGWIRGRSLGANYEWGAIMREQSADRRNALAADAAAGGTAAAAGRTGQSAAAVAGGDPAGLRGLEELYHELFSDAGGDSEDDGGDRRKSRQSEDPDGEDRGADRGGRGQQV